MYDDLLILFFMIWGFQGTSRGLLVPSRKQVPKKLQSGKLLPHRVFLHFRSAIIFACFWHCFWEASCPNFSDLGVIIFFKQAEPQSAEEHFFAETVIMGGAKRSPQTGLCRGDQGNICKQACRSPQFRTTSLLSSGWHRRAVGTLVLLAASVL